MTDYVVLDNTTIRSQNDKTKIKNNKSQSRQSLINGMGGSTSKEDFMKSFIEKRKRNDKMIDERMQKQSTFNNGMQLNISQFKQIKKLGQGSFGVVNLYKKKDSGNLYAIK